MRPRHAICVSRDDGLRRVIEDTLSASGLTVTHTESIPADAGGAALVVVDRATREAAGGALAGVAAPVVIVGDDLENEALIAVMSEAPVSHVVADPHDRDLGITSEKLASGDLFGIEKYLSCDAVVSERVVVSDIDRRHAVGEITAWADSVARRPVVHRIENVADELMMNALHDTPGARGETRAVLRWGADDRVIAVSVSDGFGALRQRDVIDHVRRARSERGKPKPESDDGRGAGLGLYLVLANVASLVVNVEAGARTEVVCLFDRARAGHPAASAARSLHVFQAAAT